MHDKNSMPLDILNLKKTNIFVVGDIILDNYIEGKVSRISPEAPVPVILEKGQRFVPGGAGNVAANVASMGAQVYLCGRIGNDFNGKRMQEVFEQFQIHSSTLIISNHVPTITKTRVLSGSMYSSNAQQIVRIDNEVIMALSEQEEHMVIAHYQNFLKEKQNTALVISDYGKGFLSKTLISKLIEISEKQHVPVVTDPKFEDVDRYAGSTVIKPNLNEGRLLFRVKCPGIFYQDFEEEIKALTECYLQYSGARNLVMSLSEHGVIVMGLDMSDKLHLETKALQVSDVSGAGDTLVAFLAMGLAAKLSLSRATEIGNIAAGIVCGKQGTATLSLSEFLENFKILSEATHPEKSVALASLANLVGDLQKQNRKIVFTNGCFDILHAGHVDYLQKSRALGDMLVVGLNSDASVTRLKGPKRPIQTASDRAAILASLSCVDYVVEFDEDTPLETIVALKPDIIVKGSDYNFETTVGAKEVCGWGGMVKHIDLLPGRSTTSILERALK
jgi:D-beta-D-heptose 7-phosphate kinase/D-beta-D-heptose 1-phosphate adenosyltransferase